MVYHPQRKNKVRTRDGLTHFRAVVFWAAFFLLFVWVYYYAFAFFALEESPAMISERGYESQESAAADTRPDIELLPDLVPLPPQDLVITEEEGRLLLRFSATYYNQGLGRLELRADQTALQTTPEGSTGDIEHAIAQRIYRADGTFSDRYAGTFLWHEEHTHFHFSDFALYVLESASDNGSPEHTSISDKATFCVRDVSRVDLELMNRAPEALYRTCGNGIQGVSVGWGDSYLAAFPGQAVDITDMSSGTYILSFVANPAMRLSESSYTNNQSSVVVLIDKESATVVVLEERPRVTPTVEHIYLEQKPETNPIFPYES